MMANRCLPLDVSIRIFSGFCSEFRVEARLLQCVSLRDFGDDHILECMR